MLPSLNSCSSQLDLEVALHPFPGDALLGEAPEGAWEPRALFGAQRCKAVMALEVSMAWESYGNPLPFASH